MRMKVEKQPSENAFGVQEIFGFKGSPEYPIATLTHSTAEAEVHTQIETDRAVSISGLSLSMFPLYLPCPLLWSHNDDNALSVV